MYFSKNIGTTREVELAKDQNLVHRTVAHCLPMEMEMFMHIFPTPYMQQITVDKNLDLQLEMKYTQLLACLIFHTLYRQTL